MIRKIPPETGTYHFHNENPKGKRAGDCAVRAIATATGKSWETVLTELTEVALKHKIMTNEKKCIEKYLESQGWTKKKQPRKGDNTKYTGAEFCELLNEENPGNVIATIGGHHIVCIKRHEGIYKVHDTWNCTDKCIGNYWI